MVQEVEEDGENDEQDDGEQTLSEGGVDDRSPRHEMLPEHLDRLQGRPGREHDRDEDRDLQGVVDETFDVELGGRLEDVLAKGLPVGHRVGDNADQGRKPEQHVAEMDVGDCGGQIVLEGLIEVEKNQQDDDPDEDCPELGAPAPCLLFGHVVLEVRQLGRGGGASRIGGVGRMVD